MFSELADTHQEPNNANALQSGKSSIAGHGFFSVGKIFMKRERKSLSVDNLSVLVAVLVDKRLVVLSHATQRHTHV